MKEWSALRTSSVDDVVANPSLVIIPSVLVYVDKYEFISQENSYYDREEALHAYCPIPATIKGSDTTITYYSH